MVPLRALAEAFEAGLTPDWNAVFDARQRHRWSCRAIPSTGSDTGCRSDPAIRRPGTCSAGQGEPLDQPDGPLSFTAAISANQPAYLSAHRAAGRPFLPAAAYLESLLALQDAVFGRFDRPITDLVFHQSLWLSDEPIALRTEFSHSSEGGAEVRILGSAGGEPQLYASGRLGAIGESRPSMALPMPADIAGESERALGQSEIYEAYAAVGLDYGSELQLLSKAATYLGGYAVGTLRGVAAGIGDFLPPLLADAATHALAALLPEPVALRAFRYDWFRLVKKPRATELTTVMRLTDPAPGAELAVDLAVFEGRELVFELFGMQLAAVHTATVMPAEDAGSAAPGSATPGGELAGDSSLERLIRLRLAAVLGVADVDSLDPYSRFVELGLNSIGAIELKGLLETALGMELAGPVALRYPSIDQLTEHVRQLLAERGEELAEESVR